MTGRVHGSQASEPPLSVCIITDKPWSYDICLCFCPAWGASRVSLIFLHVAAVRSGSSVLIEGRSVIDAVYKVWNYIKVVFISTATQLLSSRRVDLKRCNVASLMSFTYATCILTTIQITRSHNYSA